MPQKKDILENLLQELKRGTLVLSVLLNTSESTYGYSLVNRLQGQDIKIEQNTLYPLLRRLEKQGLLESQWDTSESRPRKYYQLSQLGAEVKEVLKQEWKNMNKIIETIIKKGDKK
jgi:PadR family transcriptional regulator, regulatory protein PadR